jgi:hypothetical protein
MVPFKSKKCKVAYVFNVKMLSKKQMVGNANRALRKRVLGG